MNLQLGTLADANSSTRLKNKLKGHENEHRYPMPTCSLGAITWSFLGILFSNEAAIASMTTAAPKGQIAAFLGSALTVLPADAQPALQQTEGVQVVPFSLVRATGSTP
jgi:hypothetical protein